VIHRLQLPVDGMGDGMRRTALVSRHWFERMFQMDVFGNGPHEHGVQAAC